MAKDRLLDRYLTGTLDTHETQARRQSAIKVLLALTDLERNTRAGALTMEAIRERLGGGITDVGLKDSVSYSYGSDDQVVYC